MNEKYVKIDSKSANITVHPEPSGKVQPGMYAFEDGGVIIWIGTLESMQSCQLQINSDWFKQHGHRYLKGVPT